jgi:DNA-binding PadR family transcriptional regulator
VDPLRVARHGAQPRARYYELTAEGRRQLAAQVAGWERASGAVDRVLRFAPQGA